MRKQADFDAQNLAAARLILEHPEGYEALVEWARRVIERLEKSNADHLPHGRRNIVDSRDGENGQARGAEALPRADS